MEYGVYPYHYGEVVMEYGVYPYHYGEVVMGYVVCVPITSKGGCGM